MSAKGRFSHFVDVLRVHFVSFPLQLKITVNELNDSSAFKIEQLMLMTVYILRPFILQNLTVFPPSIFILYKKNLMPPPKRRPSKNDKIPIEKSKNRQSKITSVSLFIN